MKKEEWSMRGCGGWGVEKVRYGIDLLPLYRSARQVLSAPPPPSHLFFTPLKSVFSLISLIWKRQPDSHPQSLGWAYLLPQAPRPVFSLIFDFWQTKFIAFLGLAPLPNKIVVGRGRGGGLCCCISGSRVK